MQRLVSVLIPAHNAERWIGNAITSALSQTWPHIEVVVVNDGSTDDTLATASRFESNVVRVVTQDNRGASAARNTALRFARGDYIQWLDADDLLAPHKIAAQLREVESGSAGAVLLSGPHAEFTVRPERATPVPNALWRDLEPVEFFLTRFNQNLWIGNSAWLVSRRLTELTGPWNERLSLDDDGEYFARMVTKCQRIKFVADAYTYYRRASVGSLSRSVSDKASESLLLSLQLCIGYLRSLEDSDRTKAAALRFLQSWIDLSDCFPPDKDDLFRRLCELGRELGGELMPPLLSWKYRLLKAAFGWKAVRRTKAVVSNARLLARLQRDRLLTLARP